MLETLGDDVILGMNDIGSFLRMLPQPAEECAGEEALLEAVAGGQPPAPGEAGGGT